jgi:hypothetical protein
LKKAINPAHNESEQNQYPIAYATNHSDDGEKRNTETRNNSFATAAFS